MSDPLVLAHRGARRVAPENTIDAFTQALALGADGVELDVHRTSDDGLVVHHDAEAGELGVLATRTIDDIRAARPDIPTLAEALDACAGALVNVEIKNLPGDADFDPDERVAELVLELLLGRGGRDDVLVSSFNLATIDHLRSLDVRSGDLSSKEAVPTAFLVMFGIDPLVALDLCHDRGHGSFHPFLGLLADGAAASTIERAHALGIRVNTWTLNDAAEARRLATAGIDGIVTDVPDAILGALGRQPLPRSAEPRE